MDPITAAGLAAMAGSLGGEAGRQAWQGLAALVRRPFRGAASADDGALQVSSGEPELSALAGDPDDPMRAQALATALGVRAALDVDFRALLDEWWQRAQDASPSVVVNNSFSGTSHGGPVLQGKDFSGTTFHTTYGGSAPDAERG
ncbi:hypothetical protein AB0467_02310 [Streptomyces sp. NPDC052095]|uniref:hypothetical protein n=1 Tax=unclassified Streptomyces TaxID=2593676 RepID=UPI00344E62A1